MLHKYTKYCSSETLIKIIEDQHKDEQSMHILLSVFKKSLHLIEERFDRDGLFDAIHKITVREGEIDEPVAWMFVVKGGFTYYDMPFHMSEFITLTEWNKQYLKFDEGGVYAVLTEQDMIDLAELKERRELEAIKKFIKANIFYPYYIQEQHLQEFLPLLRIKKLKYGQKLNWKDEDGSHKIGIVYKGLVSVEYRWRRKIEVVQLTQGKYLTNHYIKDQLEEISDYELETVDPKNHKAEEFPKFTYASKSDQTVLVIFNLRLIKEPPYNVNPDLLPAIKQNYEHYTQSLYSSIGLSSANKLYRNKSQVKESLKKGQVRQQAKKNINWQISKTSVISSPVLRTYATIELDHSPFSSTYSIGRPLTTREKTKVTFGPKSPARNTEIQRSKTIETDRPLSHPRLIHNTWVEEMSKKPKLKTKSFSNLETLSSNPFNKTLEAPSKEEMSLDNKPAFFVPDQFVKKKLRLKYEGLVKRVRNMDLRLNEDKQQNLFQKMARLEEQVQSKRLIKVNNARKKYKLMRDKVEY